MTPNEKREILVENVLTREKKNQYSQDINKRTMIESGYGDCSGTVWYWIPVSISLSAPCKDTSPTISLRWGMTFCES